MATPQNGLTSKQQSFVKDVVAGLSYTQAARRAGYAFPSEEGTSLMKRPNILAAIDAERKKYEKVEDVSRKKIVDGLLEAAEMSKMMGDPQGMVAAYRELARIYGHYAPEKKLVDVSVNGAIQMNRIENATDEELLRIIEGELVTEGLEDVLELPHFPQPEIPESGDADDLVAGDVNPF